MRKVLLLFLILIKSVSSFCVITVTDLRVEYLHNPLGISTVTPRLSWKVFSHENDQIQTAFQILVASSDDLLLDDIADFWESDIIDSSQNIHVVYHGKTLHSRDKCWWKVRVWDKDGNVSDWSDHAFFEIGLLSDKDWKAKWIKSAISFNDYSHPSPKFRREFTVDKEIHSARLYVSSKGLYIYTLNGQGVGDAVFTPGFTSFDNHIQYQVYDVTTMLHQGLNASGILLGNGWFRAFNPVFSTMRSEKDLQVIAQLEIEYEDGSQTIIITDENWKSSTGAILLSEIYDGEIYDARLEQPDWNKAGFDSSGWSDVYVSNEELVSLSATISPPVRKIEEIRPIAILFTPAGDTVFDMGQNMVGWCRLQLDCLEDITITLRHAEILDKYGNFYTDNLKSAKQEVRYTCKGNGFEQYEPHFTYHGFRYVSVSGLPGEVSKDLLTGIVIHSDLELTGDFSSNSNMINQLQTNIVWSQKGNFFDIPTDCPQRNERLGWTGDVQIFAPASVFNMHCAAFYTKWLRDLKADQSEDGSVPWVIPDIIGRAGAHGWGDAAVIVPWVLYQYYGDIQILQNQYQSMRSWVDYIRNEAGDDFIWRPAERQFGDWLAFSTTRSDYPGATTDKDLSATAYFFHSVNLLGNVATILGYTQEATEYQILKENIKKAFNDEFVTPNGRISSNTQTAYVLALSFDLLPDEIQSIAASRLADDVNAFGHITTGFLGTAAICHVLTKYGYIDEAYKLIYRDEYPSWLYPVTKGATTIWERWDGIKPNGDLQDPEMNSFNHFAYGAVGNWLYQVVAGINPDPNYPGFRKIIIKPYPGGEMNHVAAHHDSPYGRITSEWNVSAGIMQVNVTIPTNTTANIYIPSTDYYLYVDEMDEVEWVPEYQPGLKYHFLKTQVGSGKYTFRTAFSFKQQ